MRFEVALHSTYITVLGLVQMLTFYIKSADGGFKVKHMPQAQATAAASPLQLGWHKTQVVQLKKEPNNNIFSRSNELVFQTHHYRHKK